MSGSRDSPAGPAFPRRRRSARVGAVYQDGAETSADHQATEPAATFRRCYEGHRHLETIKDVALLGGQSEYVISGSDEGHIFIWDFDTGEIVNVLVAGDTCIRGLAAHPWDPVLASSSDEGIIKIWSPEAEEAAKLNNLNSILDANSREMAGGDRPRQTGPVLMNVLQAMGDLESPRARGSPMRCAIQ